MNKVLRKKLENAICILRDVLENEECSLENLPEGIRESERGEKMQEGIDVIENAVFELEELVS